MGLEPQNANKKQILTSKCQRKMKKSRLHSSATHRSKPVLRGKKHNLMRERYNCTNMACPTFPLLLLCVSTYTILCSLYLILQFKYEEDAEKAVSDLNNRWFNGRPIHAELSPVTDFRYVFSLHGFFFFKFCWTEVHFMGPLVPSVAVFG